MKGDDWFVVVIFTVIGFCIGVVVMGLGFVEPLKRDVTELGSSICEEEYKMEFDYYNTREGLHCKNKIGEDRYGGIAVVFNVEGDK